MKKVTLIKKINYYKENVFFKTSIIKEEKFATLEEAFEMMRSIKIKYIENKKYISAYEELSLLYKDEENHYIKYNKSIDLTTKEEVNNIPEEVCDV